MRWIMAAVLFFGAWVSAIAKQNDTTELAFQLGELTGSESVCELAIDQEKLKSFIEQHVPADDMEFARTMENRSIVFSVTFSQMSPSTKTAHCFQMRRLVKSLGLGAS